MISDETIREFQKAAKEEYGTDMTFEEASRTLRELTGYYSTLAKIAARDEELRKLLIPADESHTEQTPEKP